MAEIKIWGETFSITKSTLEQDAEAPTKQARSERLRIESSLILSTLEKLSDRKESFLQ
jgi:hypothetical protein